LYRFSSIMGMLMAITVVSGWDATSANLSQAPSTGQAAGYITGTAGVVWTAAQQAQYPGFVQIDQSPDITASDQLADIFDFESGAVTLADLPTLITNARAGYYAGTRPGQRWPAVYCDQSNQTPVANALEAAGLTNVPIWLADYNLTQAQAISEIQEASGPYPLIAVQYNDAGVYDQDEFSQDWLETVSATPTAPPGQWKNAGDWNWAQVMIVGVGLDGTLYSFSYDVNTGEWSSAAPE
jgi:hypothetical protein